MRGGNTYIGLGLVIKWAKWRGVKMKDGHRLFVKVRKEGGSRVLALTAFLPVNFNIVKVIREDYKDKGDKQWVRLRLEKVA